MCLLDEQGRLFGLVSIVDIGVLILAYFLSAPMARFAYELYYETPGIDRVEPSRVLVTASKDSSFAVYGKRFTPESVVSFEAVPLKTIFKGPKQLVAVLEAGEITPGSYTLKVINRRGLRTVWREPLSVYSLPPILQSVEPRQFRSREQLRIALMGKNFTKDSSVAVGAYYFQNVELVSPAQLEAWGTPVMYPGIYPVRVTNRFGQFSQLENVISVSDPLMTPEVPPIEPPTAPPIEPPTAPPIEPPRVPMQVLCVFFRDPNLGPKSKSLKKGAVTSDGDRTRPMAKILTILNETSLPKSNARFVLARVTLVCTWQPRDPDPGRGNIYFYKGTEVDIGKVFPFQFDELFIRGTVVTEPEPLQEGWSE